MHKTMMRMRIVFTSLLFVGVITLSISISVSPSPDFVCTICESGGEIRNLDGQITTSDGQTTTCGALKDHVALLPLDACEDLQFIANDPCGCQKVIAMTTNTRITQADAGSILPPKPETGYNTIECSICANGEMGNPNGYTLSATGQPVTCQELHDMRATITSESMCDRMQSLANIPCGCRGVSGMTSNSITIGDLFGGEKVTGVSYSDSTVCSICGDGLMRNPGGIVTNDRGKQKTCAELETNRANIPANTCSSLQASALEPCACDFDLLSVIHSNSDEDQADESFLCSICGEGKVMTNSTAVVRISEGQPEVLCGSLNVNAHKFSPDTCNNIQAISSEICGCIASSKINEYVADSSLENENVEDELVKCSVCGDGEMTIPEGIVITRQGKSARCDVLDENPKNISQKACANIQGLSRYPCGCSFPEPNIDILDEIVPFKCSVCNGGEITVFDGIVATPEGQAVRCDILEMNANTIPEDACPQIQAIANDPCGCSTPTTNNTSYNSNANEQESIDLDIDESLICHVCGGPAQEIGIPGKMVVTSAGMFTCYSVHSAGLIGAIAVDECKNVQIAVQKECGCFVDVPTVAPSDPPFVCSICGDGRDVTRPDGIIDGTNNNTCSQYEAVAAKGEISEDQCLVLQQVSDIACGCKEILPVPTAVPTSYECQICGKGRMVGFPDADLILPNLQKMSCGDVQRHAEAGIIQELQCAQVQPIALENCGCLDKPAPELFECQICGDGLGVTNPNGIVVIPTQPDRTCAELMEAAAIGHITPNQCFLLNPFVQAPCECISTYTDVLSDTSSLSPTAPTVSPAPTDITMQDDCFSDLRDIQSMERNVENTSVARKYILCPGKTFHMGIWTEEGEIKDGQPFLALRPNVIYQCGVNGNRMDNCVLKGGDFAVASYDEVIEGIDEIVTGVEIRGLTFESQNLFSVLLKSAGDVTIVGCAFKRNNNNAPILIQWEAEETRTSKSRRTSNGNDTFEEYVDDELKQVVTFQDCVFQENSVSDFVSFPGIIENTFDSELIVTNCIFKDNVYGSIDNPSNVGYAIRSFGPLTLEASCFLNNVFLNYAPVLVYGAQYFATKNYVESSQTDLTCEFSALFSSYDDMAETIPRCEMSDVNACGFSQSPTTSPTISLFQAPVEILEEQDSEKESSVNINAHTSGSTFVAITASTCILSLMMQHFLVFYF